jgi:diguanylate cyclase (GGDEF)-like protein
LDFEIQRKDRSGFVRWLSVSGTPIRDGRGRFTGYRGIGRDITARKQAEESVKHLAHFDTLTGLPNRAMFMERLAQEMAHAQRKGGALALLLLDLDHFKGVNDTLGHDQGDRLLVQAAQRITACLRQSDTVARIGGDEFVVILTDIEDSQPIERAAEKVLEAMGTPFNLAAGTGFVSASVGIALYPRDAQTIDELLKSADQAMYAAKDAGRNRFSFFTSALQERAQHRLWLIREMHDALRDGHFWVAYQPIIDLATGRCNKAEALLRWQHPVRGAINPGEFIAVAESCGLITPIGDWVFEQAAMQVRSWRARIDPTFQVSVNKSPLQFSNPVRSTAPWGTRLAAMGLDGNSIVAEITEGLLLDGNPLVAETLKAMGEAGIQVALDDFGTGFSSLAYLQKHDIDYLKIDQAFVRNMAPGTKDLSLCEAIVVMAHKLGLQVIAEGVETEQQRDLLRAAGCDFAQGYFFSRPVSAEALEAHLQSLTAPPVSAHQK